MHKIGVPHSSGSSCGPENILYRLFKIDLNVDPNGAGLLNVA